MGRCLGGCHAIAVGARPFAVGFRDRFDGFCFLASRHRRVGEANGTTGETTADGLEDRAVEAVGPEGQPKSSRAPRAASRSAARRHAPGRGRDTQAVRDTRLREREAIVGGLRVQWANPAARRNG